jgi:hypothetical protein
VLAITAFEQSSSSDIHALRILRQLPRFLRAPPLLLLALPGLLFDFQLVGEHELDGDSGVNDDSLMHGLDGDVVMLVVGVEVAEGR